MGRRPIPTVERFWARVRKDANDKGCWFWEGTRTRTGYGLITRSTVEGGGAVPAYRFSYELANGKIPEGLEIDHVCREPSCVRPDHLEAVTRRENLMRGETLAARQASKTACPRGHPYDVTNTYAYRGYRYCRACRGMKAQERG